MKRAERQRTISMLAIAGVAGVTLLTGVLLRVRHENSPLWAIVGRPVVVLALGGLFVWRWSWCRWLLCAIGVRYTIWFAMASQRDSLPDGMRALAFAAALASLGSTAALALSKPVVSVSANAPPAI
jgi:hypothetical protein